MPASRMPEEFYQTVKTLLPPLKSVGARGGRPPIDNHTVLKVIWYVLTTGSRWCDVPLEMGCCGETARMRLKEWQGLGVWDQLHLAMLKRLNQSGKLQHEIVVVDSAQVRAHGGGDRAGPSPVDRGKPGRKYTLLVDAHGIPLGLRITGANASDQGQVIPIIVEEFPHVGGVPGRPREKPREVYADAGYDNDWARAILSWLGIEPHLRRWREPHGSGLGQVRWVVERTLSWFKGFRRMRVSYDRTDSILDAWGKLAMSIINFHLWTAEAA